MNGICDDMKDGDIEWMRSLVLADGDLRLIFVKREIVTPPDQAVQAYHFVMRHAGTGEEMGRINIKAGHTENILRYRGHVGYAVHEKFQGHRCATRSCRLLVPVLRRLGLDPVVLTCNSDNVASRKSIERLGARFTGLESVPEGSLLDPFYPAEAKTKRRYEWRLPDGSDASSERRRL